MAWVLSSSVELRVPGDGLRDACRWYERWLDLDVVEPLPVFRAGASRVRLMPRSGPREVACSSLSLDVPSAIEAANALIAAGARLSAPIAEWSDAYRIEVVDPFEVRWRLVQPCPEGVAPIRADLRSWALQHRTGIARFEGVARVGRCEPNFGVVDFDEARPTLFSSTLAPAALGLPHYEEYDGWCTTGEPWFFWYYRSDGLRILLRFSSYVPAGCL